MERSDLLRCVANDMLHLVLMPTEACNFRCTYCYEDFACGSMQPAVQRGVKEFLTRRAAGLHQLELSWFGGEPLLALDVITDISAHACELQRRYPQLQYTGEVTTNGSLLTRSRFERLLDLGVSRYQISFDGPKQWHDRKRVRAGGGATFDRIWARTLALRGIERDFAVTIRLHVDPENATAVPEFIRRYAGAFGDDRRFTLFIRRINRLGGPNDAALAVFDAATGEAVCAALGRYAETMGVINVTTMQHAVVCYATRGNSFVVRADGRLNKCTVALEHPNNLVGRIDAEGKLDLDVPKMNHWMRGLWSGDAEELECPMHGYADPEPRVPTALPAPPPTVAALASAPVRLVLPRVTA